MGEGDWQAEFTRYKQIPQYSQLNAGMSLSDFKTIYWWEWSHRFLGRMVGLVFGLPFVIFAIRRQLGARLAASACASIRRRSPRKGSRACGRSTSARSTCSG